MPDYSEDQDKSKSRKQQILDESKKRFKQCEEAEKDARTLALDDLKFRAGDQWPEAIKQKMVQERKPALTINVLPAREHQILNEIRQNRPAIKVSPIDETGDEDTADILQGVIRHIEYESDADIAYDTGGASAVRAGFGFIRLLLEMESPTSFQQIIKIKRIRNAFTVYLDPNAQEADGSDAEYGYIFTTLTKEEFKAEYPDSALAGLDDWNTVGANDPGWLSEDGVRIVEYFYRENKKDTLLLVQNRAGDQRPMLKSEFEATPAKLQKGVKVVNQRPTTVPAMHWCKHSSEEILEETTWAGKWVPIIPIYGDELDVDGKLIREGIVRHAKDPMRMQNYMASKEVQAIALAPNAPYVAAAGQVENHPEWKDANTENYSVLTYDPVEHANAPERNVAEPPIQAISQARAQFAADLKAVTGIEDAQLGARSNETSGQAILQRKSQGEISNFHFQDNLTRAIRFLGRQLIDLIPKIYTQPQMIRIIGEDGSQKVVKVNQQFQLEDGTTKKYDLTVGRYDVTVSAGPSFQTRRQEAVASLLDLFKSFPPFAQIAGDLAVGLMDFPNHEAVADRLKKLLPPGVADDSEGDPAAKLQQAQAQMQQMAQQTQLVSGELQKLQQEKAGKVVDNEYRLQQSREANEVKLAVAEISTKAQQQSERIEFIADLVQKLHVSAHEAAMQAQEHAHQKDVAAQQAQAAQAQQSTQIAADQQNQSTQIAADQQGADSNTQD